MANTKDTPKIEITQISLRDHFAGLYMAGIAKRLANQYSEYWKSDKEDLIIQEDCDCFTEIQAKNAYRLADIMLEVREINPDEL